MNQTSTMSKIISMLKRYSGLLLLSILLSVISVLASLYVPILFGSAIDQIIGVNEVHFSEMMQLLVQCGIFILLYGISTWCMNLINNRVAYHVTKNMRNQAIEKIQRLPLQYLDTHSTGDIVSRIITDADTFSDGLLLGLSQLFTGVFTIIMTLIFMFQKSIPITIMVLCLTPLSFFVARFIAKRSYTMFRAQAKARADETVYIEEMIGNQKVVNEFAYEQRASSHFAKLNEDLRNYSQHAIFYSSLTNPSTRAVNSFIYACVALVGTLFIGNHILTIGGLTVLLSYANQYMKPFNDISSVITEFQNALACGERIFALLEADDEIPENNATLENVQGNVDFANVNFSYIPDIPLIQDFNLHVPVGTHVAIVGPTGAGKSTIINLLMRFYDVDHGVIKIENTPIQDVTRHSLRHNYGMVLQETWLKNGTVRENIAFGKNDASDEDIIKAAKLTHAWDFIKRLPKKLDEIIDENSLSQGQKQLLCITRVMLHIPAILILDEATSAIDTKTELHIQSAFDYLMKGRTSFVVAHRLSTIRHADIILVMKDGKVIEQGNHETLMAQDGFYKNLYTSQFVQSEH